MTNDLFSDVFLHLYEQITDDHVRIVSSEKTTKYTVKFSALEAYLEYVNI